MGLHEYLDDVKSQIRNRQAKELVEEELKHHIEDQAAAFLETGMEEEKAWEEAVRQMGDPVSVGTELDRIHRPGMDWKLLSFVGFLSLLGLAVQWGVCDDSQFLRQCTATAAGFGVMLLICWLDYSILGRKATLLHTLFLTGICFLSWFGPTVNGGQLYLRPLRYLFAPLFAGILYHYRGGGWKELGICGIYFLISLLMPRKAVTLPVCGDLGVICLIMTVMAIRRGWFLVDRKKAYLVLGGVVVVFPAVFLWFHGLADYQIRRLQAALMPWTISDDVDFMASYIREIIQGSSLLGTAAGINPLPSNAHSDYVLLQIISYYGILAGLAVVALLAALLYRIFKNGRKQNNQLGYMVGLSCGLIFFVEIFHYVMANLGLTQVGVIGLPLFSYGRYQTIVTYVLLGLVMSIYRYKDVVREMKPGQYKNLVKEK